ncbi:MAG: thiolase domain-containing protein [Deltaproteobacteria bacterium]|nr:thiolase domain-containing protein [Deltaproteobacteria bacterium]
MARVFIAGGAHSKYIGKFHSDFIWKKHPDFGKKENPDLEWYLRESAVDALASVAATAAAVDKAFVGNFAGELFGKQGHLGAMLAAADPDLAGKPIWRVEGACASGGLAIAAAVDAIRAGSDVVLVVGAEVQNTENAKVGADYLARAAHYKRQRDIDPFTFPALFGIRAKAMVEQTEATMDDFARASAKAYSNANKNPLAHMTSYQMSFEMAALASDKNPVFLSNEAIKPYLRVSDCSQVSDGASAVVLCSEKGLERIGRELTQCSEIIASQVATASLTADPDPLCLENTITAAQRAYKEAGLSAYDVQVAEVHDCFTPNEVLMYEALGFAPAGQGALMLREGQTSLDGPLPVNTGGGLVGFGHPVGATGVKQVLEIYRQMKGQCGEYQLAKTPGIGLCANMGGDDRTTAIHLVRDLT